MTRPAEGPGTNPVVEIINNSVEAHAKLGDGGKWQGVIAYAADHDKTVGASILETPTMYDSEEEAKDAMTVEIVRVLDAAKAVQAADADALGTE